MSELIFFVVLFLSFQVAKTIEEDVCAFHELSLLKSNMYTASQKDGYNTELTDFTVQEIYDESTLKTNQTSEKLKCKFPSEIGKNDVKYGGEMKIICYWFVKDEVLIELSESSDFNKASPSKIMNNLVNNIVSQSNGKDIMYEGENFAFIGQNLGNNNSSDTSLLENFEFDSVTEISSFNTRGLNTLKDVISIYLVLLKVKVPDAAMNTMLSNSTAKGSEELKSMMHDGSLLSITCFAKSTNKNTTTKISENNLNFNIEVGNTEIILRDVFRDDLKQSKKRFTGFSPHCHYWDDDEDAFSTKGCTTFQNVEGVIDCYCNHTTTFAILLKADYFQLPNDIKDISMLTGIISLLFLAANFVILILLRTRVHGQRINVQLNLIIALFCLHISLLLQDTAVTIPEFCFIIAALVHFFLIAVGMWMFLEGVTLVMKTTKISMKLNEEKMKQAIKIFLVIGWGIPIVVVGVTVVYSTFVTSDGYLKNSYLYDKAFADLQSQNASITSMNGTYQKNEICWVNTDGSLLIYSVILPLAILLSSNALMMLWIGKVIFSMNKEIDKLRITSGKRKHMTSEVKYLNSSAKGCFLLFPVLGIPWALAFLTNIQNTDVSIWFIYLNTVVNGLQGLFLFIVYVFMNSEVKSILKNMYIRRVSGYVTQNDTSLTEKTKDPISKYIHNTKL